MIETGLGYDDLGNLISFDALPSLLAACLVLLLGTFPSQRVVVFSRYSIPSLVVGGILFAIDAAIDAAIPICISGNSIAWRTPPRLPCC